MTIRILAVFFSLALSTAVPVTGQAPQSPPARQNSPAATCTDLSRSIKVPCPNEDGSLPPEKDQPQAAQSGPAVANDAPASTPVKGGGSSVPQGQSPKAATQSRPTAPSAASTPPDAAPRTQAWFRTPLSQLSYSPASLRKLPRNFAIDQRNFWTSPARVRVGDFLLLAPLAGATAGFIVNDSSLEKHLPTSPTLIKRSKDFGTYGAAGFAGAVGGAYLLGKLRQDDRMTETGLLSGVAAANTFALTFLVKSATGRQRPLEGNGQGDFRAGGVSFPSEHSAAAWSIATVIAHEFPGPLTQFLAYGAAGAMTASRVLGRQHFASDALVGSALGWFVGRQVYNAHHDGAGQERQYGTFIPSPRERQARDAANMASSYVSMDSWVYDAFDRLIALGYVKSAFVGIRPWTRMECARLIEEAAESMGDDSPNSAHAAYQELVSEFAAEQRRRDGERNLGATLESVYTRFTAISGQPLRDSYHFGQTIINDYGRPYGEGFNLVTGASARAEAGPLAFYVRGEYQHAPSVPALPLTARQTIAGVDFVPSSIPPGTPAEPVNQFRLLDAYVAVNLANWQVSFGKQSLWWGPGLGGPMMISDNAEPINMLRINRVTPFKLPSILGWLGPIRTEYFIGQLSGYELVFGPSGFVGQYGESLRSQPFIHGQKISFQPTPNFEFGVFRTTIYGGPGYPLTAHTLLRSLLATGNERLGAANKPGDRRSGIDFSYRVPGLRDWLSFYGDGFADDEFSPIGYFDRSVWRAGIYMPRLPRLHKMDLRAEGVYTDNPLGGALGHGFYYFNFTWRSGYQNNGNLIGSWIGRQGQGAQAWATYHLSAKNLVQLNFRHQKVSHEFLPGGGTLTDAGVRSDYWISPYLSLTGLLQYEKWKFPTIAPAAESNVVGSFQVTFWPGHRTEK